MATRLTKAELEALVERLEARVADLESQLAEGEPDSRLAELAARCELLEKQLVAAGERVVRVARAAALGGGNVKITARPAPIREPRPPSLPAPIGPTIRTRGEKAPQKHRKPRRGFVGEEV